MALVKLNEVEFGGYECVSEIDDEALSLSDVESDVCATVAREVCLGEVVEKEMDCDCVTKYDVNFLVELSAVSVAVEFNVLFENFAIFDTVAFPVVEAVDCG